MYLLPLMCCIIIMYVIYNKPVVIGDYIFIYVCVYVCMNVCIFVLVKDNVFDPIFKILSKDQ